MIIKGVMKVLKIEEQSEQQGHRIFPKHKPTHTELLLFCQMHFLKAVICEVHSNFCFSLEEFEEPIKLGSHISLEKKAQMLNEFFCFVAFFASILPTCNLLFSGLSVFEVEHARTEEQIQWGLMQRRALPDNHGMLFHHAQSQKVNFWSFNCYVDLSVAFIDEKGSVCEIKTLKAFPEKMDPSRPVFSIKDFSFYPPSDPVVLFFQKTSITSSVPVKYVLEMNLGWFEKNEVRVGDVLYWNDLSNIAFFFHGKN